MRYMMLIAGSEDEAALDDDDRQVGDDRVRSWWNAHVRAGRIVAGQRLAPSSAATTVRIGTNGSATISDSPLVEATEVVASYAILDVADLDAAIQLASTWPHAGAALEIRPIMRD